MAARKKTETGYVPNETVETPEVENKVYTSIDISPDVSHNISLVQFPSDRLGVCVELKKGALKTLSKVSADHEKLELILETLSVIASHAVAKYNDKVGENA